MTTTIEGEQRTRFDSTSIPITVTTRSDEEETTNTILTTTLLEGTPTFTSETTPTTLMFQELSTLSTTIIDELSVMNASSMTVLSTTLSPTTIPSSTMPSTTISFTNETLSTVTSEMTTITTSTSDVLTTIVVPVPEPKADNRSGSEARDIRTTAFSHDTTLKTTANSTFIRFDEMSTTTRASTFSSQSVTAATQVVPNGTLPTSDDQLIGTTFKPETNETEYTNKSTTIDPEESPELVDSTDQPTISLFEPELKPGQKGSTTMVKSTPFEPTLSPTSCTNDVCLNGGTCVLASDGWQVIPIKSNLIFQENSNSFFFLTVPMFMEK